VDEVLTLLRTVHGQTTTTAKDTTANNPRPPPTHNGQLPYVQGERQMAMKRSIGKTVLRHDTIS